MNIAVEPRYDYTAKYLADYAVDSEDSELAVTITDEMIDHEQELNIKIHGHEMNPALCEAIAILRVICDYIIHREMPTGKGFADLVLIPRKNVDKPAVVLELKYDKSVDAAINQIHRKNYPTKLAQYTGDILLVGINYDRQTKVHTCRIETFTLS